MRLSGQVAIVTGASRGIGRAIAVAFAQEGARLTLAARTVNELEETARQVRSQGGECLVVKTDVTSSIQIEAMVNHTLEEFGAIDILVNNAGMIGPLGRLHETDPDEWARAIQVNLIGPYLCCRAVLPVMLQQDHGKIINVSGGGGPSVPPGSERLTAYATSKAALLRLTEMISLNTEGTKVECNALGPGMVETQMWAEISERALKTGNEDMHNASQQVLAGGGAPMQGTVDIALFLATNASDGLSGRTIQQALLPGGKSDDLDQIHSRIPEIMKSSMLKLRRVGLR